MLYPILIFKYCFIDKDDVMVTVCLSVMILFLSRLIVACSIIEQLSRLVMSEIKKISRIRRTW